MAAGRKYATHYETQAPLRNSVIKWMKKFKEAGSVNDKPWSWRPWISKELLNKIK